MDCNIEKTKDALQSAQAGYCSTSQLAGIELKQAIAQSSEPIKKKRFASKKNFFVFTVLAMVLAASPLIAQINRAPLMLFFDSTDGNGWAIYGNDNNNNPDAADQNIPTDGNTGIIIPDQNQPIIIPDQNTAADQNTPSDQNDSTGQNDANWNIWGQEQQHDLNVPVPQCASDSDCSVGQVCCGNNCFEPACKIDSDCSDQNEMTIDSCTGAATCGAQCSNTATESGKEKEKQKKEPKEGITEIQEAPEVSESDFEALVNGNKPKIVFEKPEDGNKTKRISAEDKEKNKGKDLSTLVALADSIGFVTDNPNVEIENDFVVPQKSEKIKDFAGTNWVKQNISIKNNSNEEQTALIAMELVTRFEEFGKEDETFTAGAGNKRWRAKRNSLLINMPGDENAVEIEMIKGNYLNFLENSGSINWKDMVEAGANPTVFIKKQAGKTKISLAFMLTLAGGETRIIDPVYDLNEAIAGTSMFTARWDGNRTGNFELSYTGGSGSGVQLVDIDNNGYANDLILRAINASTNTMNANGAVYLIRDIDKKSGIKVMDLDANFDASFEGGLAGDYLSYTNKSGNGAKVVDIDNNGYTNDLVLSSYLATGLGINSGTIILIKDIDKKYGRFILDNGDVNYALRLVGGASLDYLGGNNTNFADGTRIADVDNNGYANDFIINAPYADALGLTDNGAVYLIKDVDKKYGTRVLDSDVNFDARWLGGASSDYIGETDYSGPGAQLVNIDNNAYANDLVITAVSASTFGRTDNGAAYLIKDIDKKYGTRRLDSDVNFDARWDGNYSNDKLGYIGRTGRGVQVANIDNNAYANDFVIGASIADTNTTDNNAGSIFLIKDVDKKYGTFVLDKDTNFAARWDANNANDYLGSGSEQAFYTNQQSVKIVNIDNNAYTNDLLITASWADTHGRYDNGSVYLIKDIDKKNGRYLLDSDANFDARWDGNISQDNLGWTLISGEGVQLVNVDNNAYANDLILTASQANIFGLTDNGAVYLIKDVDKKYGVFLLDHDINYSAKWAGAGTSDFLGRTVGSGQGVQAVDLDNNGYSNDLIISAVNADTYSRTINGAVYIIKDIDKKSGSFVLDTDKNFDARFDGNKNSDYLGYTHSNTQTTVGIDYNAVLQANLDNGGYANDIVVAASNADTQGRSNNGAVYVIKNVDKKYGTFVLDTDTNFDMRYDGGAANDRLGSDSGSNTQMYYPSTQIVNSDNEGFPNDLLLSAATADSSGGTNNGSVFYIRNFFDQNTPDVNVIKVDSSLVVNGLPNYLYANDGNLTIDFNVYNAANYRMKVDINYSTSQVQGTGTVIVRDLNLDSSVCEQQTWGTTPQTCTWDWNIMGVPDGNYYINMYITGLSASDFNSSVNSVHVNSACTCPTSGNWEINSNAKCTIIGKCAMGTNGDLHIDNATLVIPNGATLSIANGRKIIIEKAANSKLVIEKGGSLILNKTGN